MRLAWALISIFVVESVVFGLAVAPAVVFWHWHFTWAVSPLWLRSVVLAMAFVPAYLLFAAGLDRVVVVVDAVVGMAHAATWLV